MLLLLAPPGCCSCPAEGNAAAVAAVTAAVSPLLAPAPPPPPPPTAAASPLYPKHEHASRSSDSAAHCPTHAGMPRMRDRPLPCAVRSKTLRLCANPIVWGSRPLMLNPAADRALPCSSSRVNPVRHATTGGRWCRLQLPRHNDLSPAGEISWLCVHNHQQQQQHGKQRAAASKHTAVTRLLIGDSGKLCNLLVGPELSTVPTTQALT